MADVPSDASNRTQRVLLLGNPAPEWVRWLEQNAVVQRISGPDEIPGAARDGAPALVVCPHGDLLSWVAAVARDQSRAVLDGIPQGVCSVGRDGALLWSNAALRNYPAEVAEAIQAVCAQFVAEMAAPGAQRTRRQVLKVAGFAFDVTGSAVPEAGPAIDRVVAIVWDVTSMSRLRDKLDAIDAAGRQLITLDIEAARLELPERLRLLEDKVIRHCHELLQFEHFDVFVLDRQSNRLENVLAGGTLKSDRWPSMSALPEGNGICGYVAATGRSYVCPDIRTDPLYLPGLDCAASSLTVPLRLNDQVVGVLNVESDQPARFTDEDRQFAEIFAHYIATALHMLKLLVVERSETTGQLAADVRAELSEPLSDIVAEATSLLQDPQLPAETTPRVRAILDHVERVRAALQAVGKAPRIHGLLSVPEEPRSRLAGKRVLIADDETIIRETIADLMEKAGAMPMLARDGNAAIAMLRSQPFDLVLSDIKMPYKNGYEVFAAAKEANPHCPVILITGFGYDPEHSIVRASHEGLAGVLFKPFKVEQLLELIEKALAPAADPG